MSVEKCYNLRNYEYEMSIDVSFFAFYSNQSCSCDIDLYL